MNAPTLEETSFYKALKLAEGAVSILDVGGKCFTRVWCAYECFISLTQIDGLKYEVYTALEHDSKNYTTMNNSHPRSAVGIVDGLGKSVGNQDTGDDVDEDTQDKAFRERYFPVALAQEAFALKLETAQASVETDRIKILNTIAEQTEDLAAEPLATHPRYDALNALLRGRFAVVALRGLLDAGKSIEQAAALVKGCARRKLELCFDGVEAFDANAMHLIAQNLPPTLEELDMARGGLTADHLPALTSALSDPASKLTTLKCVPPLCPPLPASILAFWLSDFPGLVTVSSH